MGAAAVGSQQMLHKSDRRLADCGSQRQKGQRACWLRPSRYRAMPPAARQQSDFIGQITLWPLYIKR